MIRSTIEILKNASPTAISIAGAVVFLALNLVIRAYLNPLSGYPGPWISKYTGLYEKYQFLSGNKPRYVHRLHKKYGPIVRVSPTELAISDASAAKEIHRVGGRFLKSEFYDNIGHRGGKTLFNTTDPHRHAIRRKLLSAGMTRNNLAQLEPDVMKRVRLAIQRMAEEKKNRGVIDVFKWWTFMASDVIAELSFGESFKTLEQGQETQFVKALQNQSFFMAIRTTFPTLLPYAQLIPLPIFKEVQAGGQRIFMHARQAIGRYKTMLESGVSTRKTLFTNILKGGPDGLTELEIIQEACGYIVAGSDTTAITLTYLVWSVCKNPSIRDKLVEEVKALPEDFSEEHVRDLPYLNQVINEALRIHSAVPSALPRKVPPEGAKLAGYQIPGGTTVSTQAYTLHRDPDLFPIAESFNPARWENPTKDMKHGFMPFGGGSRICIGMHLAWMELLLGATLFFRTFPNAKVSIREGMCDEDMVMNMYLLVSPVARRCLIEA
ncbi:putative cytochrome P450 [Talaromyces proteolyticus]|uniref:Cytochrome P450 n=1 Tax=Talaromyces proteolyticus TaxID=1131652 RepID=A0AAD4Q5G4_9EURO|nr:putative cytochrome P450 [Talaromyces proteolyticus]KAH8703985.1 putative cytochrome P450 [Talaromyces proteolyticus]